MARRSLLPAGLVLLALVVVLPSASAKPHRPGTLDTSFAPQNSLRFAVVPSSSFGDGVSEFAGLALTSGGRIVLTGDTGNPSGEYALAGLRSNGAIDSGFGVPPYHVVVDGISTDDDVTAAAPAPGGGLYIAARSNSGSDRFGVARFTAGGMVDPGFGGGTTTTPIGDGAGPFGMAVQRNGRVLLAGYARFGGIVQIAVVRYLTSGIPDPSFGGGDGVVTTRLGDEAAANDIGVQRNGRIVVVGNAERGGFGRVDSVALRYRSDGSLDRSFANHGVARFRITDLSSAVALAIGSKSKAVIAGFVGVNQKPFVARLTARGKRDHSFGAGDGLVRSIGQRGFPRITDLGLQRNGKIVLVGFGGDIPLVDGGTLVTRLRANGAVDTGFANHGSRLFLLGGTGGLTTRLAILPSGKIVVAGGLVVGSGFFAARLFGDPVRR